MKVFIKGLKWVLISILVIVVGLYIFGYGYIFKGIQVSYLTGHTSAFIDDYPYFDNRTIETSSPQVWSMSDDYNSQLPTQRLKETHEKYGTVAFLIIKDGEIWHEHYDEGYDKFSKTNSFSMAKSITTSLLFKAIQDGYIQNLDQPLLDFFPDYEGKYASETTVGDLASMASGLNWVEEYFSPFSITAQSYYDSNIRELMMGLKINEKPGQSFKYLSGNTELLGMIIEKASGKNLSEYLSQSFWRPMGMNDFGMWQLDGVDSGMEKAFCCIATNARNFAKFGQLYLQQGNWKGKQLIDSTYTTLATQPRFDDSSHYGYGFWLSQYKGRKMFTMNGFLGQYVVSIPEDDLIIVRLGHKRDSEKVNHYPKEFYIYIDEVYEMLAVKP